jgi:sugar phosphate isomerase/epimerase
MKVGLCTIAYQDRSLEEALERAAAAQFYGVELWGKPPHLPIGAGEAEGRALGEAIRAHGLEAAVFGSYLRGIEEPFAAASEGLLAVARGLRAPLVRVWAADRGSARADAALYALLARNLSALCARGAEIGLRFVLERHDNTLTDTIDSTLRLLEMAPAPNLGVNYQIAGDEDTGAALEGIRRLRGKIWNVHAQNHRREEDGALRPSDLVSGEIDYEQVVPSLRRAGYDGYLEIEFIRRGTIPSSQLDALAAERALRADYALLRRLAADTSIRSDDA